MRSPRYIMALIILVLTGCNAFRPTEPPVAHYTQVDFSCPSIGASAFSDVDITLNKCVDSNLFRKGVYVRMHIQSKTNDNFVQNIVMQNFENFNFFEQVYTREPTIYINARPHPIQIIGDDPWYEFDDPLSVNQIRDWYGENILIADVTLLSDDPYARIGASQSFLVNLIDPRDGATIIMARAGGSDWLGFERVSINPVMHVIHEWLDLSAKNEGKVWT